MAERKVWEVSPVIQVGLRYEELVVTTSAQGLPLGNVDVDEVRRILIHAVDGDVRWIAVDGQSPTVSSGMKLSADDMLVYDGDPELIQFVRDSASAATPTLLIHFFGE